jgi:hypothetical protein
MGPHVSGIRYTFRPSDTVDTAVRVVVGVEALEAGRLSTWDLERVFTTDLGTSPQLADSSHGIADARGGTLGVRQGAVSVNGRLPPEVIQRIVRQNNGRFRLCYENGLRSNPALRGRVTVRFVIDGTGAVVNVTDGGSDLPDKGVVACVTRAFSSLTFPQPDGGIVTVVYPIIFSPAS